MSDLLWFRSAWLHAIFSDLVCDHVLFLRHSCMQYSLNAACVPYYLLALYYYYLLVSAARYTLVF